MQSTARAFGLAVVAALLLVGCGKHYWNKPGAGAQDFAKDSSEWARPIPGGRRFYPAVLKITEDGSRLRGDLDVTGMDLKGSAPVVKSAQTMGMSGRFGGHALAISFTLTVSGKSLEAAGLGADN